MQAKENYIAKDTTELKTQTIIYTYSLKGKLELWNNKYLGLREYYNSFKNI